MNTTLLKYIVTGLLLILIFASGFWLSRSGKPYSALIFNIHKLIALAAAGLLIVTIVRAGRVVPLRSIEIAGIVITALFFVGLVVAGGLLSVFDGGGMANASQAVQAGIKVVHHVLPYLAALSTIGSMYLLIGHRL